MAQHTPITIKVSIAWWLPIYISAIKTLCEITGMEPNQDRVGYWVCKGLKAEVVTTSRSKQHDH